MDQKKTYYNSVLSKLKPKFTKFLYRKNKRVDADGNSMRDDLEDLTIDFSYMDKGVKNSKNRRSHSGFGMDHSGSNLTKKGRKGGYI